MKNFYLILILFLYFSCGEKQYKPDDALRLAGENRMELEKVLKHYKDDPLKYKAAVFLIENMPFHFYYEGKQLDSYSNINEALIRKKDYSFVIDSFKTLYGHCSTIKADSLLFDNAPSNALFYLKNHTRGNDERIFIYKDEVQIFL